MSCEHWHLAKGRSADVTYCRDCDVLYVAVGPVTVRLSRETMADLRDTLIVALRNHALMVSQGESEMPMGKGAH